MNDSGRNNSTKTNRKAKHTLSRRQFIGGTASVLASVSVVPRHVLGGAGHTPPSEKLNIAAIGAGGMGRGNLRNCATENIVALCDVDDKRAAGAYRDYPDAKKYKDFRKMLDKEKNIDAVIVATPDHTHFVAGMASIKHGKHVYVQKPLTHSIYEARKLTEAAREANVVTQMGNQGHSGEGNRLIKEWIADGAIGEVREVHVWTPKPIWPQGITRPKETPPVPSHLDWDLWLGPVPELPYHPAYLPFRWRGWWDFGTGVLGDMGCHIIDTPFWALELGHPESIQASCTNQIIYGGSGYDAKRMVIDDSPTYPLASMITYEFGARGNMPPVTMTWYDGGLMPPRPDDLEPGRSMGDNEHGGFLFVGEKGKLKCNCYGHSPRIIPEEKMRAYDRPPKTLRRVPNGASGHEQEWISAIKEGRKASTDFEYAGPLTEVVLLGNIAIKMEDEKTKLLWDGKNVKVTNVPAANQYIQREYRSGWEV